MTGKIKIEKPNDAKISTKIKRIPEELTQPSTVQKNACNKKKKGEKSLNSSKEYVLTQKEEESANRDVEIDEKQDKPKEKKNRNKSRSCAESPIDPQEVSVTARYKLGFSSNIFNFRSQSAKIVLTIYQRKALASIIITNSNRFLTQANLLQIKQIR